MAERLSHRTRPDAYRSSRQRWLLAVEAGLAVVLVALPLLFGGVPVERLDDFAVGVALLGLSGYNVRAVRLGDDHSRAVVRFTALLALWVAAFSLDVRGFSTLALASLVIAVAEFFVSVLAFHA